MANTLKILYWLRKNKTNKTGQCPLIIRISYQRTKTERATGYYVDPKNWNTSKQRVKGEGTHTQHVNTWIDNTTVRLGEQFRESVHKNEVHLPTLLNRVFTTPIEDMTLLKAIQEHNSSFRERVGNDFSYSTYEKYVITYKKVKAFIESQYKRRDLYLRELNVKFIIEFDHYLRVEDNNQHNTAVKYCLNLKKIINGCVLQGSMSINPFRNYKTAYRDTQQVYLEANEVDRIERARLLKNNHILTRDLFLFQCYTGLAYADLSTLTTADFSTDLNNRNWIIKCRQKSGITSTIPLLPKALALVEKYRNSRLGNSVIFPQYSIQKYNQYLGEIGDLIGLEKKLSSHVGRRTFGNLALSRGISINVISKILGHSNTLITQRIYAITTQNIISSEILKWR